MSFAYQIVVNTPLWVWPLLLFVLWLGWRGLKPRVISPARLAILPLIGLGTSLAGVAQSLQPGLALAGWAVALLVAFPLGWTIGMRRAVRLRPEDGQLEVAGGWFALGFGISIFAVRYTLGVLSGVMPGLRLEPLWIVLSGSVGGIVTGIGVGWLANLLLRAYRPARAKA
ncbi:MAG TPA: hypothetical protein VFF19_14225 [Reyranella sp.]|jgi:hypothetical protein|nr:hypothetical protein [Reyranella sp.]